jgi:hypothetical protein
MEFRNAKAGLRDVPGFNRWQDDFPSSFPAFKWPQEVSESIYRMTWPLLLILREENPERIGLTWDEQGEVGFIVQSFILGFRGIVTDHPQFDQPLIKKLFKELEDGQLIEAANTLKSGLWFPDSVTRVACADILMRMKYTATRALESIENVFDIYR